MTDRHICVNCGAMAFMEIDTCDICGKPFSAAKADKKQMSKNRKPSGSAEAGKKQRRKKMSFKEFEAAKRQLNRLNYKLMESAVKETSTSPSDIKKWKAEIKVLKSDLENNFRLAFLFN